MPERVQIRGMQGLLANLHRLDEAAKDRVREVVVRGAADTHRLAFELCPKDTGRMARSLTTEFSPEGFVFTLFYDEEQFPDTYYPPYVEFGTRFSPAQPSLGPAFETMAPHIADDVLAAIRAAMDEAGE